MAAAGLGATLVCGGLLWRSLARAPYLVLDATASTQALPEVAVIVPAYNEADNIDACVRSILASTVAPTLEVWVVDDQSTDQTWAILETLQAELGDPRLHLLAGRPRPQGWMGKTWACQQAVEQAGGDVLLFLDADVRLQPGALEASGRYLVDSALDLLTLGPAVVCEHWAEWLVQPVIFCLLVIGFNFEQVNDPHDPKAFGAGPFMLFRRSAYTAVGGHASVADVIVEDVALAQRIKSQGLRLRYLLGPDVAAIRMYRSAAGLWEGWTKNLHLGCDRRAWLTLSIGAIALVTCTSPWLSLLGAAGRLLITGLTLPTALALGLSLSTVGLHYGLRRLLNRATRIPPRHWWWTGAGGLAVAAIAVGSVIKTETGWGWTWRGRPLQLPGDPKTL